MTWKVHGRCHKFILLGDCHAVNVVAPFESSVCFCSLKMLMILRHFVALHDSQLRKWSTEFLRLSVALREAKVHHFLVYAVPVLQSSGGFQES